jgi:MFS family permease
LLKTGILRNFTIRDTFASLKYPNYRLWFFGQLVSLVGTWMQSAAQGYLIYDLTGSPAYLGYVGFAFGLPSWFFTLYAGVIADRLSRRTILIAAQSSMMILAFILAALTFTGLVQPWHIIVLAFLLGIATAFDAPTRQAFVLELVDRQDLNNAIALNSTMFTSAIVVGPAVGGLVYAWLGPAWCFTLNGITYIAIIIALALMKLEPVLKPETRGHIWHDLRLGLGFIRSSHVVRMLIVNMGVISLIGLGIITLIPAWAVDILGGDATTNGLLLSARGLGSLIGALMIASLGGSFIRGRLWSLGSFVFPLVLIIFAQIRLLPLSLLALVGVGWAFISLINTSNALVQSHVPDELRGRVMSVYVLVFFGALPIGSLVAGQMATRVGEPLTVTISALFLLGFAVLVWFRAPDLRQLK